MSVLTGLARPFFILAPMDDVTDSVFRRMVASCAPPDLFYTEFVNVDGLQSPGRPKLEKKIYVAPEEMSEGDAGDGDGGAAGGGAGGVGGRTAARPIIAQLWGKNPENFRKSAAELVERGFAGIDLNMGCPAKTEVSNGTCSALINNRPLAHEIIEATKAGAAGRVPVSVKTRLGFNVIDLTWHEFLLKHALDMLVVHGRTRKEMSKVPAHWDEIGKVRQLRDEMGVRTLVVGNGDVHNRAHGEQLAARYGLDGIMVGRGIFHDPYVFAAGETAAAAKAVAPDGGSGGSPWGTVDAGERLALYERHVRLFAKTWRPGERPIHTLNKFCKIYVSGFDGAKELREQLMQAQSTDELLDSLAQTRAAVL